MQTMPNIKRKLMIALVDEIGSLTQSTRQRLAVLGHRITTFNSSSDLSAIFKSGQRFDLLLISLQNDVDLKNLSQVCSTFNMPALIFAKDNTWKYLLSWNESYLWSDVIYPDAMMFTGDELEWRLLALHQRGVALEKGIFSKDIVWGDYKFSMRDKTVSLRGEHIDLQPRQFDLAYELFCNVGRVVPRDWILSTLWKKSSVRRGSRTVDVCVTNLRRKLNLKEENGFVLQAVYGAGYKLIGVPIHSCTAAWKRNSELNNVSTSVPFS